MGSPRAMCQYSLPFVQDVCGIFCESLAVASKMIALLSVLLLYINVICWAVHWFACQVVNCRPYVAVFAYS